MSVYTFKNMIEIHTNIIISTTQINSQMGVYVWERGGDERARSDDKESESYDEWSDEIIKLALVGINDEGIIKGNTEVLVDSDVSYSEISHSEVNSFNYDSSTNTHIFEYLTMWELSNVSIEEFLALKDENNKLK